jgi:hypothetical protein
MSRELWMERSGAMFSGSPMNGASSFTSDTRDISIISPCGGVVNRVTCSCALIL